MTSGIDHGTRVASLRRESVYDTASGLAEKSETISVHQAGTLPDGRCVEAWRLSGRGGLTLEVLTYGGIVRKLLIPDSDGRAVDVVLGLNDLQQYIDGHPYFGAIVGRVAGRLTGAAFQLDGRSHMVLPNEPPNHLHGGVRGFDKQLWKATSVVRADQAPSVQFDYCSPNGEEGYPGNVDVSVTYTVTNENVFLIETNATTDQATPFSLTHHSYFNLAGEASGSIASHTLQIVADTCIGTREDLTLLDRAEPVEGTADALRQPRMLAKVLPLLIGEHGALYPVPKPAVPGELMVVARLAHPGSGRVLTCSTTNTHLQLYTASAFDGSIQGKSGQPYEKYAGLCLECEGYANGANAPEMGDILLRPGQPQTHTTT